MIKDFFETIAKQLHDTAAERSVVYGFDFENDRPLTRPGSRYIWEELPKADLPGVVSEGGEDSSE